MKNVTDYKDKNVLVVGLGKSGLNSAYLLKELGANVTVNERIFQPISKSYLSWKMLVSK